ncbi:MAG: hypothetical protein WBA46_05350 [Thermomicrobiales bacterium]
MSSSSASSDVTGETGGGAAAPHSIPHSGNRFPRTVTRIGAPSGEKGTSATPAERRPAHAPVRRD